MEQKLIITIMHGERESEREREREREREEEEEVPVIFEPPCTSFSIIVYFLTQYNHTECQM